MDQQKIVGASALTLANDYLKQGGRLIIDPKGKLDAVGDMAWLWTPNARKARHSYAICRRFFRRLKDERFAQTVKCFVIANGQRTAHGWLVMDGGAA